MQVGLLQDHNPPLQERLAQLAGMIKARGGGEGDWGHSRQAYA